MGLEWWIDYVHHPSLHTMPDGAYAYPAYAVSETGFVGLIRRSRHQAMALACGFLWNDFVHHPSLHTMPNGAYAYPAYAVSETGFVGLIRRSRHQAFLQQHRFSLYIKSHSEGVVSPLKSANRSVNDKVWTPWMADRGEPRQGLVPEWNE
ncbi:hypothetical protein ACX122_05010 [Kosakonia cowanii]